MEEGTSRSYERKGHVGESNGLREEEETVNVLNGSCGGSTKYGGSGSRDSAGPPDTRHTFFPDL